MQNSWTSTLREAWVVAKESFLHPLSTSHLDENGEVYARSKDGVVTFVKPKGGEACSCYAPKKQG